jgi:hypothetical protein
VLTGGVQRADGDTHWTGPAVRAQGYCTIQIHTNEDMMSLQALWRHCWSKYRASNHVDVAGTAGHVFDKLFKTCPVVAVEACSNLRGGKLCALCRVWCEFHAYCGPVMVHRWQKNHTAMDSADTQKLRQRQIGHKGSR